MDSRTTKRRKPRIAISRTDHERLTRLAQSVPERSQDVADDLMAELDRARIVPDNRIAGDIVRMGSKLRYSTDSGENREVTLVFPADADIATGRISILTPIGTALIGLSQGQSIDWEARDGRLRQLTVENVAAPISTPPSAP